MTCWSAPAGCGGGFVAGTVVGVILVVLLIAGLAVARPARAAAAVDPVVLLRE